MLGCRVHIFAQGLVVEAHQRLLLGVNATLIGERKQTSCRVWKTLPHPRGVMSNITRITDQDKEVSELE